MKVLKSTRLEGNPRKRKRTARKMSPKQIKIFGTKRQKAALKAKRTRKNAAKPVRVKRRASVKRSSNPLVLHLRPMERSNPKRSKAAMAKPRKRRTMKNKRRRVVSVTRRRTRRASNPRRSNRRRAVAHYRPRRRNTHHRRRTRRNGPTTRVVVMAPRRANRRGGRRRNPNLFGSSLGSKNTLMILGGGLIGVAAVKFIPTLIPANITSGLGTSMFGPFLISGLSAFAAWWLASKVNAPFGEGVLFGGLMQTASVALNAFLPNLTIGGVPIALGDLVPGRFVVPQNPLRQGGGGGMLAAPSHAMAPAGSKVTASGLGRAYPSAY